MGQESTRFPAGQSARGVLYLVDVSTLPTGAAWVAILLRQLQSCSCLHNIRHSAADKLDPRECTGAVVVIGFNPAQLDQQTGLLQSLPRETLKIVSASKIHPDVALLLRECGATLVVDSVGSAHMASRLVDRFLLQNTEKSPAVWDTLPWSEMAR